MKKIMGRKLIGRFSQKIDESTLLELGNYAQPTHFLGLWTFLLATIVRENV
jgi:hypothetical protein